MTYALVENPFSTFLNLDGRGLNDGDVYIGVAGQDPQTNPQAVYWDDAGTIPAAQPLEVLGGHIMYLGTPARAYTGATYSIRVRDRFGNQVFYAANAGSDEIVPVGLWVDFPTTAFDANAKRVFTSGYATVGVGGAFYALDPDQVDGAGSSLTRRKSLDGRWFKLDEPEWAPEMLGAVGGDATKDQPAIQGILDAGKPLVGRKVQYELGTTGVRVKFDAQVIKGNRMILNYTGSGHAFDLDDNFASVTPNRWAQDCYFENFYVYCQNTCLSAIRWRFSYSTAIMVSTAVLASTSTAWRIDVDATTGNAGAGGSGPYYNEFVNCNATGKTTVVGVTNQTGWLLTSFPGTGSRAPNANVWTGGRTSGFTNNHVVRGHGNKFLGVTSEGVYTGGYHFLIDNPFSTIGDAGNYGNAVLGPYLEGNVGANGFYIGATSTAAVITHDAPTSLGGTYFTDLGAGTTWQRAEGIYMPNTASTDPRTFDWYQEGTFTPVLYGSTTPGVNTYAVQMGRYTRLGNRVHFDVSILMTAKDAALAGEVRIGPLPFTSAAGSSGSTAISNIRLDLSAGYSFVGGRIDAVRNYVILLQNGDNVAPALLQAASVVANTEVYLSGTYQV